MTFVNSSVRCGTRCAMSPFVALQVAIVVVLYSSLFLPTVYCSSDSDCVEARSVCDGQRDPRQDVLDNVEVTATCTTSNQTHGSVGGGWDQGGFEEPQTIQGLWYECVGPGLIRECGTLLTPSSSSGDGNKQSQVIANFTSYSSCMISGCLIPNDDGYIYPLSTETCIVDIDECADATLNNCDANANCSNTVGNFTCTCNPGYTGDGVTCTNIDECDIGTDGCDQICTNNVGSFECSCMQGYVLDIDATSCLDVDECSEGSHSCSINANCSNTVGNFTCTCNPGYTGDGFNCTNIDECDIGTDNCDQICTNNIGSFECSCVQGYVLDIDGASCLDVDECSEGSHSCSVNANCSNTNRSFTCTCNPGYTGDGVNCMDIDECLTGDDNCDMNEDCKNTNGSFYCTCREGFNRSGISGDCTNIDECALGTNNCHDNATCNDTIGSFTCTCNSGFEGDGIDCTDINECAGDNECEQKCMNQIGHYFCDCNAGYNLANDSYGNMTKCRLRTWGMTLLSTSIILFVIILVAIVFLVLAFKSKKEKKRRWFSPEDKIFDPLYKPVDFSPLKPVHLSVSCESIFLHTLYSPARELSSDSESINSESTQQISSRDREPMDKAVVDTSAGVDSGYEHNEEIAFSDSRLDDFSLSDEPFLPGTDDDELALDQTHEANDIAIIPVPQQPLVTQHHQYYTSEMAHSFSQSSNHPEKQGNSSPAYVEHSFATGLPVIVEEPHAVAHKEQESTMISSPSYLSLPEMHQWGGGLAVSPLPTSLNESCHVQNHFTPYHLKTPDEICEQANHTSADALPTSCIKRASLVQDDLKPYVQIDLKISEEKYQQASHSSADQSSQTLMSLPKPYVRNDFNPSEGYFPEVSGQFAIATHNGVLQSEHEMDLCEDATSGTNRGSVTFSIDDGVSLTDEIENCLPIPRAQGGHSSLEGLSLGSQNYIKLASENGLRIDIPFEPTPMRVAEGYVSENHPVLNSKVKKVAPSILNPILSPEDHGDYILSLNDAEPKLICQQEHRAPLNGYYSNFPS